VGVDVGGTFTDVVVYDAEAQTLRVGKSPTDPADPTRGLLHAFAKLGIGLPATERLVHGTTIGTNAILERRGADVWVVTTRGFGDTLEIARTNRTVLYDIRALKPASLVPRQRVLEVDERMAFDGSVLRPLDAAGVAEAAARMGAVANGGAPGAAAICFLHSYANPAHEETAARLVRERLPGWFVCTSREVLPEWREYEALAARGHAGAVFITTSSGGITTADVAARFPVHTVLSGPAGGVAAALHLGRLAGCPDLITCDMGGTSTDVCLIEQLEATLSTEQHIAGLPNRTPQIEINSIGAGGGSLAWLDAGDTLRVGPRSAGATPGPACYGRGGVEPTITDANLLLGRVPRDVPLAGEVALDETLARGAIARLRERIPGIADDARLAEGIIRIATARMVSAIKEISIAKGHDPRDFTLLAYGGAGPMHAAFIADELEIRRVMVPWAPGNFSALGSLIGDVRRDYVQTRLLSTRSAAFAEVVEGFAALEREATAALVSEGIAPERISALRALGMRYVGQAWELLVRVPDEAASMAALDEAFHRSHERRYGHRNDGPVEIVNFRLTAVGATPKPPLPRPRASGPAAARRTERPVYFDGAFVVSPVYERERLAGGACLSGPAVVEEMGATTVVPPRWSATVGAWGELVLERKGP
jgi:N-methylhydantoinase A